MQKIGLLNILKPCNINIKYFPVNSKDFIDKILNYISSKNESIEINIG